MTVLPTRCLIVFVLLLFSSAAFAETTRCTPITSLPTTITKQGTFCLFKPLSHKSGKGAAITINANNVVLDLNGHTLSGLAGGPETLASGIYAINRQNITIKNGIVRGFRFGVFLSDSSAGSNVAQRYLVEDIRASKNTESAIWVFGVGHIVRNNQVLDTGGSPYFTRAIYLRGASGRVINNEVSRTIAVDDIAAAAILVDDSQGAVIENNRIDTVKSDSEFTYGIRVKSVTNVAITNNTISESELGVWIGFSDNVKYRNNLTYGVTTPYQGGTDAGGND